MIPFIQVPPISIGTLQIQPFGILVSAAVITGYLWMLRRARQMGLRRDVIHGMTFWLLIVGFPVSVVLKWLYMPNFLETLLHAPGQLIREGFVMVSFGGIFGGFAAALLYLWNTGNSGEAMWKYLDVLAYAFPRGFIFGRLGCAVAHDHPGIRTDHWLGVQFPGGSRFDLGLLEVFFLFFLIGAMTLLGRRTWPAGSTLGFFLVVYGIFRFLLDYLHEDPPRYLGITLDHWFSLIAMAGGAFVLWQARQSRSTLLEQRAVRP